MGMGNVFAETYSTQHDHARLQFISSKWKEAKYDTWTSKYAFMVSVFDTGEAQNNYANYICDVLYAYGFKGKKVVVQVTDVIALTRYGKLRLLGEAKCK